MSVFRRCLLLALVALAAAGAARGEATLPDTIAAIGPRAFRDCAALRNITCY